MNILVLMAGRGKRFSDKGYTLPKPLIPVNGKTILEWTTESCPYIKHDGSQQDVNLYFAVLQEHLNMGVDKFLYSVYGNNITIIPFQTVTRGSLETAYISSTHIHTSGSLLVLDSDNKYDAPKLIDFVDTLSNTKQCMAIFVFDSHDKSLPNKWSNAKIENSIVVGVREKDDSWINYPALVGMFYFSDIKYFTKSAYKILQEQNPVKGEYYMSMLPANLLNNVHFHMISNVVPLGTPEDVEKYKQ